MRTFLNNFWVCLFCTMLSACASASAVQEGETGWAWFGGFMALVWLKDAMKALKRDKEDNDEPQQRD